ncbi:MAG: cobalamin-dependent protein, partial [bacterium]
MTRPPVRIVTAASLFDGHDAAIHIMRRLLQAQGAEVIHLGHDRGVDEIVEVALEESADAIAVSSYQGGHLEFFGYLIERLAEVGLSHVRVYGGGGGTITPEEIEALHRAGVAHVFSPEDGRRLGLEGMIRGILEECLEARAAAEADPAAGLRPIAERLAQASALELARLIRFFEDHAESHEEEAQALRTVIAAQEGSRAAVIGFTGTGGAGKSSVVDELVRRLRRDAPTIRMALLLVDPTRRRSGGALLGDRIRMNAIQGPQVFVRSMATRRAHLSLAAAVSDALSLLRGAAFDVVFLETAGIGQSDSEIIDQVDCSLYVMTPEYGAPSQLEKIDMIDFADLVVLNKCDRQGAADALRDVRKQWRRNRGQPALADEAVPVFPTIARSWDDPGIERLSQALQARLRSLGLGELLPEREPAQAATELPGAGGLVPGSRRRYLAEIAETARSYRARIEAEAERAALADGHARVLASLGSAAPPHPLGPIDPASRVTADASPDDEPLRARLLSRYAEAVAGIDPGVVEAAAAWPEIRERYEAASQRYVVRDRTIEVANRTETLAGTALPKV